MDVWSILSLGLKPLYEKNALYYKIVKEFRVKLPRPQNQARKLSEDEIKNHPFLPDSFAHINVVDLYSLKINITESELDEFYNKLNEYDYKFVFFKSHYRKFTANLNRLKPETGKRNLDIVVLQRVLQDDEIHPLEPIQVLIFHLKWKLPLTSKVYIGFKERKRRKELFNRGGK